MHDSDIQLPRLVTLLAILIALAIALSIPFIYFGLGYRALSSTVQTKVEIKAEMMNQLITAHPEMWRYTEPRLQEMLARYPEQMEDERIFVLDESDSILVASENAIAQPFMARDAPLYDAGKIVGRIQIHKSMLGLVRKTAIAAIFGLLLGVAAFAVLRILPLRVHRLVDDMFRSQERASVTLHSIGDAVITTDRDLIVEYLNPVAESLTGWTLAEAAGRQLSEVMQLIDEATLEPAQSPMEQALRRNETCSFTSQVALLQRDGSSLAIEGHLEISFLEVDCVECCAHGPGRGDF